MFYFQFFNFFKNLNDNSNIHEGTQLNEDILRENENIDPRNEEINIPFSAEEILIAAKALKCNKAPGIDNIVNHLYI